MAGTSVIEATRLEFCANRCRGVRLPKQPQPPGFDKAVSPPAMARHTESPPLAALTAAAQFIAHDFRHHLCAVYANAEFLGSRTMDSADREELLGEIRVAIDCMTDQLDSLILFTRTGCILKPRHHSLKLIIEQAIQMVRSHPETRDVKITQHDMSLPKGYVDGMQLCSALFNLLLNACQAAKVVPGIGTVDIDLRHDSSDVFIRVSDGGPGIPRTVRESLFQPFVKAEGSKGMGMGLGLTIARCVAQGHGGEVYLEESRPGRTVFVLKLPKALFV
jgi:signal transduction histidine kinase